MLNVVINMCEKFHYDRLRNNRAIGNGKSDSTRTTLVVSGSQNLTFIISIKFISLHMWKPRRKRPLNRLLMVAKLGQQTPLSRLHSYDDVSSKAN